jgi:hypothetical protein
MLLRLTIESFYTQGPKPRNVEIIINLFYADMKFMWCHYLLIL